MLKLLYVLGLKNKYSHRLPLGNDPINFSGGMRGVSGLVFGGLRRTSGFFNAMATNEDDLQKAGELPHRRHYTGTGQPVE